MAKEGPWQWYTGDFITLHVSKVIEFVLISKKVIFRFLRNVIYCKICPKFVQYLQRYLATCQALLHTKQNQPLMTLTMPNCFKIGPCLQEINGVWKLTLGLNNPVSVPEMKNFNDWQKARLLSPNLLHGTRHVRIFSSKSFFRLQFVRRICI